MKTATLYTINLQMKNEIMPGNEPRRRFTISLITTKQFLTFFFKGRVHITKTVIFLKRCNKKLHKDAMIPKAYVKEHESQNALLILNGLLIYTHKYLWISCAERYRG